MTNSTTAYFPVPVELMSPLLTYVSPVTRKLVTRDTVPPNIAYVDFPYDLHEWEAPPITFDDAFMMCDAA